MAHYGFHGGMAMAMLMFSLHEGTTEHRPGRPARSCATRFADEIDEIVARRAPGAAWTSPSPTPAATWRALRARGEQDADGQLVRDRPEDLHHLRPRQVPLRHRPHRGGRRPDDPFAGLDGPVDVPGAGLREDGRRHARPRSSRSTASRRSSATTARSPRRSPSSARRRSWSASAARASSYMLHAHEQRAPRRRLRVASACARRPTAWRATTPPSAARWARRSTGTR